MDENRTPYLPVLREMSNKSSQTALSTLKQIVGDISKAGNSDAGKIIVSKLANTMSDRAATEVAFNTLLETYRAEILPDVMENYDALRDDEREGLTKLNNFFCGLHLLVHFADVATKAIHEYEKVYHEDADHNAQHERSESEASTVHLIRATSKCLSRGGDEKSGCHIDFATFCALEREKVLFVRFNHNRFNIVFTLAQMVYFHRERIIRFFTDYHEPGNRLKQAVFADIKNPLLQAGVKVLGLISKLVTGPLWRLLESDISLLDMNAKYLSLVEYFTDMSNGSTDFLTGEQTPLYDLVEFDDIYQSLIVPDEAVDEFALPMAQSVFAALKELLQRMVKDQLPGGKFWDPSQTVRQQAISAIPHNKLPEFLFGQLDFLLRYRPNASLLVNEAFIMYSLNNTRDWLDSLPDDEKEDLIKDCRKQGRQYRKQFRERCAAIHVDRLRRLQNKHDEMQRKQTNLLRKKEALTDKIVYYGLWQTEEQVVNTLRELPTKKEKREALKAQIQFRKTVLKQEAQDKTVFNLSGREGYRSVPFTIQKLTDNLLQLVRASLEGTQEEAPAPDVPLLVGKKVRHTFEDGPYEGQVISVVPGYVKWYNIVYKDDPAVYSFKLQDEYREGNLEIIVPVSPLNGTTVRRYFFTIKNQSMTIRTA